MTGQILNRGQRGQIVSIDKSIEKIALKRFNSDRAWPRFCNVILNIPDLKILKFYSVNHWPTLLKSLER